MRRMRKISTFDHPEPRRDFPLIPSDETSDVELETHFEGCDAALSAPNTPDTSYRIARDHIKRQRQTPINFLISHRESVDNRRAAGGAGRGGRGECFCVELVSILETRRLGASVSSHIRTAPYAPPPGKRTGG